MAASSSGAAGHRPERWHLVPLVYLASLAILLYGLVVSPFPYTDPRFVVGYFPTEVAVAILLVATMWLVPPAAVGLRRPVLVDRRQVVPLALLVLGALLSWCAARLTLPTAAAMDGLFSLRILRTTLLVGLTEEWVYRGLVLAAACRWLGLRRGAWLAMLAFGALHLLNMAGGVPPPMALVQFVITTSVGSTLLLAALGTRSLWVPVLAHGLYDFLVFDANVARAAGAPGWTAVPAMLAIVGVGITGVLLVSRLPDGEPYPSAVAAR